MVGGKEGEVSHSLEQYEPPISSNHILPKSTLIFLLKIICLMGKKIKICAFQTLRLHHFGIDFQGYCPFFY